jgi:hypothetical protein
VSTMEETMTTDDFFAYLNRSAPVRELGMALAQALQQRTTVRRLDVEAARSCAA